jgi:hypothetical protein
MNRELLSYSIEELENAITLKRLKENKEIILSDSTNISFVDKIEYGGTSEITIEDADFDTASFPVNKENIAKLKLFINNFGSNANWVS